VERDAKAELRACLFDTTWLATMVRKNSPKDMGNDKISRVEEAHPQKSGGLFMSGSTGLLTGLLLRRVLLPHYTILQVHIIHL
jgi:hypothetical protein